MRGQSMRQPFITPHAGPLWRLWLEWTLANAIGEAIGLGLSSLLWILFFLGMEQWLGVLWSALIVVSGSTLLEGSAVGIAQWRVLGKELPALSLRIWWIATAVGALIAWTLGMIPSTLMALNAGAENALAPEVSDTVVLLLAAGMGFVLGPVLGIPQWWILRRHVAQAWQWIPANAVAWMLGMPVIFAMMGLVPAGTPSVWAILLVLTTLAVAGAVVGATHGIILVRLLTQPVSSKPPQ
jgi:hypothetical protein